MKLYGIVLLYKSTSSSKLPIILTRALDLSLFMRFTRDSAQEAMVFASRTVTDRTNRGQQQLINHLHKDCYCLVFPNGVSCVVMTDEDYPPQAAFGLARKCIMQFNDLVHPVNDFEKETADLKLESQWLEKLLKDCQDPKKADAIYRITKDLEDTQNIMRKNIEDLLRRGEKLENLLAKTTDLSENSKKFMKDAEKLNKCCYFF